MKNSALITLLALVTILFTSGCASTKTQEIEMQIEAETSETDAAGKSHHAIWNHPDLSTAQRDKLMELHKKMITETARIKKETAKIKGVFFSTLFSKKSHTKEMDILKRKLIKINQEKLDLMLDSFSETKKILGKSDFDDGFKQEFGHGFFQIH